MKYWLGLLLLITVGCANPKFDDIYAVNPELELYIQSFEYESTRLGIPLQITNLRAGFGNAKLAGPTAIGFCRRGRTPLIIIDQAYWNTATVMEREHLMFHELGHCILNLEHNNKMVPVGIYSIPESIMYLYMFDDNMYVPNREYYLRDLFLN